MPVTTTGLSKWPGRKNWAPFDYDRMICGKRFISGELIFPSRSQARSLMSRNNPREPVRRPKSRGLRPAVSLQLYRLSGVSSRVHDKKSYNSQIEVCKNCRSRSSQNRGNEADDVIVARSCRCLLIIIANLKPCHTMFRNAA